ncbi:MAG TPA: hexose kinase [Lapillicoccus sp.]|nr:hexose kinase [Lapillicoccus sp.]
MGVVVILTVTLNPALDVSYAVDALVVNGSHRVREVTTRAGGKGVNVASVLHAMGVPTVALVLAGGATGRAVTDDLARRGVATELVPCGGETRRTVNVVSAESGDATIFNEAGPVVTAEEVAAVVERVRDRVAAGATVVAVCGSLPRGADPDAYGSIVRAAREAGAVTLVDADGEALRAACLAGVEVARPNRAELLAATGVADADAGVTILQAWGARQVLVSAGAEGMRLVLADGRSLTARPRERLRGNPTGAGDAATAAVAAGVAAGRDWPEVLRDAVAWSSAAVLSPVAGDVDPVDVARLRDGVLLGES